MTKDQMSPDRRSALRIAACCGVAATAGLLLTQGCAPARRAEPAVGPAGGPAGTAGVRGAAGPAASSGRVLGASGYRLQPMVAHPYPRRRALPPVRSRPFLRLPESSGRTMVLTFDDGPDPEYTPAVLRTLRRYGVRAMFFVCGEMVEAYPRLVREMADDGHVIGNHTWSHPLIPRLTPSGIRAELGRTSEVIEAVSGLPPLWYRAPFGAWNRHSFEIGAELGMEPLAWTVDTLDWMEPGTGTIVSRVLDGAGPGVVVLSHDAGGDRSQSVAALRYYLPRLLESGYHLSVPRR
ncbi:polysaccharide deacetylase family protein [Streptomyces clavuligerus]|uniref:polysaccharide deacetylase family protein n=1 Tax=Streptomyces clavuligerus TaxID=1901 RepID=UPI000810CA4A|nr:polysaccharide deacetylase family protein [Streptomyces clavuligerus]ANW21754.1 oligosaccharide deacetylase [Streptomyces clavuligerus]AXU11584.1 polysaccharide deacetylase family protein [Streptomyces clavuligerus]MBY6301405.1 polysaccharide deacetylase family protein [Streptomyces clavuligerus]QPL61701.1 polysaccharide deacetylase family protein [Streptomyces clavuligerus]QPL73810.1 polysaccharide deacetylase family protein [Streptomyces clavuligerus]